MMKNVATWRDKTMNKNNRISPSNFVFNNWYKFWLKYKQDLFWQ